MRPVLTYAAGTRPDTTKSKNMTRTEYIKTMRTLKSMSLRDQIRNSRHSTVYEGVTTILKGPRRQNDRRSMGEMGKG
ncbi:hypothetical protein Trydic_g5184 [Trypoxylus dichotomus]